MLFSVCTAAILTLLALYIPRLENFLQQLCAVIYSIPSLAMFAMFIPLTGLGNRTAVIVLVIYNQYILLRNTLAGLHGVENTVIDAASGMGMTRMQILWRIRLPLSKKAIFTGIKLAVVSTVGIAAIAASIHAGGLGALLFDGLRTMNIVKILWGSILSAVLAVGVNLLFHLTEIRMKEKWR